MKRGKANAKREPLAVAVEPAVRLPGVFCCWIYASKCNFIGPEKTCKLGELGECPHKFIKPNAEAHASATKEPIA